MKKGMQRANNGDNSAPISLQSSKPIVLVLGSGWGAHSPHQGKLAAPANQSSPLISHRSAARKRHSTLPHGVLHMTAGVMRGSLAQVGRQGNAAADIVS